MEFDEVTNCDLIANETKAQHLTLRFYRAGCYYVKRGLNSDKAVNMNIAIMRVFVEIRKILLQKMI